MAVFYFSQVLTGQIPFRGAHESEVVFLVLEGRRPAKPENASVIGLSDLLWDLVQRCWDDNRERRPKVAEVVEHLEKAAANWDGLMPPSVPVEVVAPDSEEEMSDSYREFTM